jgi:hypothetical protein
MSTPYSCPRSVCARASLPFHDLEEPLYVREQRHRAQSHLFVVQRSRALLQSRLQLIVLVGALHVHIHPLVHALGRGTAALDVVVHQAAKRLLHQLVVRSVKQKVSAIGLGPAAPGSVDPSFL